MSGVLLTIGLAFLYSAIGIGFAVIDRRYDDSPDTGAPAIYWLLLWPCIGPMFLTCAVLDAYSIDPRRWSLDRLVDWLARRRR